MEKTLLVGLDAACWEYLDPLLQAGRLPTIQKLIDSGSQGILHSTMPPWTPTAWSTLVTAKNPGKHGVFDMLWRKPGDYKFTPVNAPLRQGTPFWKYLNEAGIRVGLVNIPFTHPPTPVDGFMLCGFGTPDSARDLTWPPEALEWVEGQLGAYYPVVSTDVLRSGRPDEILATEKRHQAYLVQAAGLLAEEHQVDVLAINLMLTDHANHKMPTLELVQEAYVQSDADIAALLNSFHPDNVFLISDHGSSRLKGDFLLNVWLREHGYCIYYKNTPSQQKAAFSWILKHWSQDHMGWSGRPEKALRRLIRTVYPWLPQSIQRRFWAKIESAIPFAESHMQLSAMPDYGRTAVFPSSLYSGLLYFNVANREPNGVVSADEKKALFARLKDELSQVQDPDTGERLFSSVFSSDELYEGPAADYAPDIIVDAYWSHWNIRTRQPAPHKGKQHSRYFVTFERNKDYGWHSPDGVYIFTGPAVQVGQASANGQLMDIPATLLHMYDVPLPEDWDGRVLSELLAPELSQRPIRRQAGDKDQINLQESAYSTDEDDAMISHLRALGYLD
ncbi:MAG: alkaline phosphatase family protein [Ardenticatenaceae bacterium]|nr:alkaline phosphatase family protein [Ardenticatenaceae bacterium]